MVEKRRFVRDIISNVMVFMVLFSISWVASFHVYEVNPFMYLFLALPWILLFAVRKFCKNSRLVVLLYSLITVAAFFLLLLGHSLPVVFMHLASVLLYNIHARKNGDFEPSYLLFAFYTFVYVFLLVLLGFLPYSGGEQAKIIFSYILLLVLFVSQLQINNLDFRIMLHQNNESTEAFGRVVKFNNAVLLLFVSAVAIVGAAAVFLPFDVVLRLYDWILSQRPGFGYHPEIPIELLAEIDGETNIGQLYGRIYNPVDLARNPFTETVFGFIITSIFLFNVILAAFYFPYRFIKWLYTRLIKGKHRTAKNLDNYEGADSGSFLEDLRDLLPTFGQRLHPVRKAYAKKVNKHIKRGMPIKKQDPTNVIAMKIRKEENIDKLTTEYEMVRYGRM